MKYCEFCNKELDNNEVCTCKETQVNIKSIRVTHKHHLWWIIGIISIIAFIVLIGAFSTTSKVDPFEYVDITFSGYNTAGKADVTFSYNDLIYDVIKEKPEDFEELMEWTEKYDVYLEGIKMEYTPQEKLTNGDEVTITFTVSGAAQKKIKSGTKSYEVVGLTEVDTIDIFNDVEIVFDGINGKGTAEVNKKSDREVLTHVQFIFSEKVGLSTDDIVTVTIGNVDELAKIYNCIPLETSKQYSVPKLAEYVKSADQIPIDSIKNIINRFIEGETPEPDDLFSYGKVKYYGTYFGVGKENAWFVKNNKLEIYIYYDEYLRGSYRRTIYEPMEFFDIIIEPDGNIILDYESGSHATFTTDIETSIEDFKEDYDVVEIEVLL